MTTMSTDDVTGLIFDVQRFSLHDGPGIRTVIFFKGCPLRCAWCQNPESLDPRAEIGFVGNLCIHCGSCVEACDQDAIALSAEGRIQRDSCNRCALCVDVCMADALSVIGEQYTVSGLLDTVQRDVDFYAESGGGITLSGGEPFRQRRFLAEFLPAAKGSGLHVTIETCGYFPWKHVEPLLANIDLVYFDIKILAADAHRNATGADNRVILDNARKFVEQGHDTVFRFPLVPGYTTDDGNLNDIIDLLGELGQRKVHLLPYHNLGEAKLEKIGSVTPGLNQPSMTREEAEAIGARFVAAGIEPIIGGA